MLGIRTHTVPDKTDIRVPKQQQITLIQRGNRYQWQRLYSLDDTEPNQRGKRVSERKRSIGGTAMPFTP
jgi:hypothetical protein